MSLAEVQAYHRFLHSFTDRYEKADLVCLNIAGVDLGSHARFFEPLLNDEKTKLFTYELKWASPLDQSLAVTGWNRRAFLLDLAKSKYQIGSWEPLPAGPLTFDADWAPLGFFWKNISGFQSPPTREVTQEGVVADIPWEAVRKVHFAKSAVNTFEVAVLDAEINIGDRNDRFSMSMNPGGEIYKKVLAKGWLSPSALASFLEAPVDTELTVFSDLGELRLPPSEEFDLTKAKLGIYESGVLRPWDSILVAAAGSHYDNANLAGMEIQKLHVSPIYGDKPNPKFPARDFYFEFSKINGQADREALVQQVSLWSKATPSDCKVEFHGDWSQFLVFETPVFNMRLSYSRSGGFGSINLNDEFYRKLLLENPKFQTSFHPDLKTPFKAVGLKFESAYGFISDEAVPAPDELQKPTPHFWREANGRQGLTVDGLLYVWEAKVLTGIHEETTDEYGDRGGPYEDIVFRFSDASDEDAAQIRLRQSGDINLEKLRAFLVHG